ncbi:uncharacterized protein PV09_03569 [Verruconis gallopava]|uniref:VOC domain-containing protein n=1 Tax=Verruconis gallopava TaxID=253628 RepID=A0A0D2B317_9PEZI|nr:uncharacterized protein PV09_03569 [Verruconis gallopava]KIW05709.1 hypothetical protein PV09_03569 [Verruconis gallopava]
MMASKTVIRALDHIVFTVRSIPATVSWYTQHLGMRHEVFRPPADPSVERHALVFGSQKINLHQAGREFEPKAKTPLPGSADVCFLTDTPVEEVLAELRSKDIEVLEGGKIVERTGAVGKLKSVYVRDPDENLIEISKYV